MRRWFLSYNSQDLALVQRLEAALRVKDPEAHIFFAPRSLRAGGYWLPVLAKEIADATVFVLLVGEKGIGDWQVTEYYEAYGRRVKTPDFPLVLVLMENVPAPGLPFLRQLHWVVTADPSSESCVAHLINAEAGVGNRPSDLWRHTAPYRGLAAMKEADCDFFFGRARETVEVIRALEESPNRLCILLGNSGVGKSSLAQAGVLAALSRQDWPEQATGSGEWPRAFHDSRQWFFLNMRPGAEPVWALVETFLRTWQLDPKDTARAKLQSNWFKDLLAGTVTLRDLLDATGLHYEDELKQPKPPAFMLYVDQGEELYARAEERQRRRFSEILTEGLRDPRLRGLMSMRSDFLGALQSDAALFDAHRKIDVPPLREADLREVVRRPAALLAARFETETLADDIARRAAEESAKDAGALPLLSYLLDDMWTQMVARGDGVLRLPPAAVEIGGVLAERASQFLARHPASEDAVRRILTLRLANVREEGDPTRRRAQRSEFSDEEWRLVGELADQPNRLLVTAMPDDGETYAEVSHEAIFRRWSKLREWLAAERDFLVWRSGVERDRRRWELAPPGAKDQALLMGHALAQAEGWFSTRRDDLPAADRTFIERSLQRERAARRDAGRMRALVGVLFAAIVAALAYSAWTNGPYLRMRASMLFEAMWSGALSPSAERTIEPGRVFRECRGCPQMVVVPAGEFTLGSTGTETESSDFEGRQVKVNIPEPFAVSRYEVTFDEWDACVMLGGCKVSPGDQAWGRDRRPVINVSWNDVQEFVAWISRRTGKSYRLLTETEWEYAARAGSMTAYPWGNEIGVNHANCSVCGSQWDNRQTAPVGSFPPNAFKLHDMHGNVWEWVDDEWDEKRPLPLTGDSGRVGAANIIYRVLRGGSWYGYPPVLRSIDRLGYPSDFRTHVLGLRVGRSLAR